MVAKLVLLGVCVVASVAAGYLKVLPSEAVAGVLGAVVGNLAPGLMKDSQ